MEKRIHFSQRYCHKERSTYCLVIIIKTQNSRIIVDNLGSSVLLAAITGSCEMQLYLLSYTSFYRNAGNVLAEKRRNN
jgi:hypothetical protein